MLIDGLARHHMSKRHYRSKLILSHYVQTLNENSANLIFTDHRNNSFKLIDNNKNTRENNQLFILLLHRCCDDLATSYRSNQATSMWVYVLIYHHHG